MSQIEWPRQARSWDAFLPSVTVQVRHGGLDAGPQRMMAVGDAQPGFMTVRQRTALGGPSLGQSTGQALFQKAKQQIARFDEIKSRALRIANKTVRDQVSDEFGLNNPGDKDKAQYARDAMAGEVARAEQYNPINYYFFESPGPQKRRPDTLAAFNDDFESAVRSAEVTYGI